MNTGCEFGLFDWFGNEKLGMFHDVMIVSTNLMCGGLYEAAKEVKPETISTLIAQSGRNLSLDRKSRKSKNQTYTLIEH